MKKRILLSISLCYLIASVAMAAETPVSSLQPPLADKKPGASVPENSSATKVNIYTIAELYKNSAELHKKKVTVHGLAIKVTSNIMGKTWTHIQDGTGDKSKGTNDLICISVVNGPKVGNVVTTTGTAMFNPKSRYTLVIEDATFNTP